MDVNLLRFTQSTFSQSFSSTYYLNISSINQGQTIPTTLNFVIFNFSMSHQYPEPIFPIDHGFSGRRNFTTRRVPAPVLISNTQYLNFNPQTFPRSLPPSPQTNASCLYTPYQLPLIQFHNTSTPNFTHTIHTKCHNSTARAAAPCPPAHSPSHP